MSGTAVTVPLQICQARTKPLLSGQHQRLEACRFCLHQRAVPTVSTGTLCTVCLDECAVVPRLTQRQKCRHVTSLVCHAHPIYYRYMSESDL